MMNSRANQPMLTAPKTMFEAAALMKMLVAAAKMASTMWPANMLP